MMLYHELLTSLNNFLFY